MNIGTLFAILVSSTLLFHFFLSQGARKRKLINRINDFIPFSTPEEIQDIKKKNFFKQIITLFSKIFKGIQFSEKTKIKLEQAGSSLRLEEFIGIRVISSLGLTFGFYLFGIPLLISSIFLPIGYLLPDFYMKRKAKKRLHLLSFQLVEALGTMANSLRAGFSFTQTMQLIGKEMPDPIGPEFERIVRELGLGIPLDKAFQSMLSRLPNKELEVVFQAILAQRKSGGNLAELLETMEETVRGRIRILEELKTLTAQGRMSSWIITLLPIVIGLYLYFISPGYFLPLLEHPLGWTMISIGVVFIIVGWILLQKIVRIEV